MTVLMTDASRMLSPEAANAYERGRLSDILFADDTLLMGIEGAHLEEYTARVEEAGREFGLQLHWGKVQLVRVRSTQDVCEPDGSLLEATPSMIYLGSLLHEDGKAASELSRRIGMCASLFKSLARLWSHAAIAKKRKFEILTALVETKLLYGLSVVWLGEAEQRKLDGFHCRCLRQIARIPPAYISYVSNKEVLRRTGQQRLSSKLLKQQLLKFQQVALEDASSQTRRCTFHGDRLTPMTAAYLRKVERPRHAWAEQLLSKGVEVFGSRSAMEQALMNEQVWKQAVQNHVF